MMILKVWTLDVQYDVNISFAVVLLTYYNTVLIIYATMHSKGFGSNGFLTLKGFFQKPRAVIIQIANVGNFCNSKRRNE